MNKEATRTAKDDRIGKQGGLCFRTACRRPNAVCRHTQNGKYYCPACAHAINRENFEGLVEFPARG